MTKYFLNRPGHYALLVFLVVASPSFLLIDEGYFLMHGLQYPLLGSAEIKDFMLNYLSVWNGEPNFDYTTTFFYLHLYLISLVTGDGYLIQLSYIYIFLVIAMCGVFFWLRKIKFGVVVSLLAAIIYILNPLGVGGFPLESVTLRNLVLFAATPYIFFTIEWFVNSKSKYKYLYLFIIHLLFISAAYSSLQYFVIHLFFIFSYFIYKINFEKFSQFKKAHFFKYTGIFLLSNMYWIVPFLFGLSENFASRQEAGINDVEMLLSSHSLLDYVLNIPDPYINEMYPFFSDYYLGFYGSKPVIILLAAIFAVFSVKFQAKYYLLFIYLLSIFLILYPEVYYFSVNSIPYLGPMLVRLFRNTTYFYLLSMLPISVLAAVGISFAIKKFGTVYKAVLLISFVLIYGSHFFLANMLKSDVNIKDTSDMHVNQLFDIPDDILLAAKEIKSDGLKHTILEYPLEIRQTAFVKLKSYSNIQYSGLSFLPFLTNSNVLSGVKNGTIDESQSRLIKSTYGYKEWLVDAKSNLIDYIVLYKSAVCAAGLPCSQYYEYFLNENPYIDLISNTENISLYMIKPEYRTTIVRVNKCKFLLNVMHSTLYKVEISNCDSKHAEIIFQKPNSSYWALSFWENKFQNESLNNLYNILFSTSLESETVNKEDAQIWIIDLENTCLKKSIF